MMGIAGMDDVALPDRTHAIQKRCESAGGTELL